MSIKECAKELLYNLDKQEMFEPKGETIDDRKVNINNAVEYTEKFIRDCLLAGRLI